MKKMLIADDNRQIVSILSEYAGKDGFEVTAVFNGLDALSQMEQTTFDMVLLDVMMPGRDGFYVCREIRRTSDTPVILITARGEDFEKIMGLEIGADDYIVKPFSPGEVMARVRAVLRRISPEARDGVKQQIRVQGLLVDLDRFITEINAEPVLLTKKETELLWLLAENSGRVFSRDQLLDSLWGYEYAGDGRTVDSHIKRLRAKLDCHEHPGWEIKTIWGVGYKFDEA